MMLSQHVLNVLESDFASGKFVRQLLVGNIISVLIIISVPSRIRAVAELLSLSLFQEQRHSTETLQENCKIGIYTVEFGQTQICLMNVCHNCPHLFQVHFRQFSSMNAIIIHSTQSHRQQNEAFSNSQTQKPRRRTGLPIQRNFESDTQPTKFPVSQKTSFYSGKFLIRASLLYSALISFCFVRTVAVTIRFGSLGC